MVAEPTDADYAEDLKTMVGEIVPNVLDGMYADNPMDGLSEAIHEEADTYVAYDTEKAMRVLKSSPHDPEEWNHMAEGVSDWEQVIQIMAFDVVEQDLWAELRRQGYVEDMDVTAKFANEVQA